MNPQQPSPTLQLKKLSGIRVLVVDDSMDDRNYLSALLSRNGAEVATASSAIEALEQARSLRPDIMVSDIGMPGKDGYALVHDIRLLDDEIAKIPVIAVTAYGSHIDREKASAAGFQRHFTKPANTEQLISAIFDLAKRGAWPSGINGV